MLAIFVQDVHTLDEGTNTVFPNLQQRLFAFLLGGEIGRNLFTRPGLCFKCSLDPPPPDAVGVPNILCYFVEGCVELV